MADTYRYGDDFDDDRNPEMMEGIDLDLAALLGQPARQSVPLSDAYSSLEGPDGSLMILGAGAEFGLMGEPADWGDNLAETIPEADLVMIAEDILDMVEEDDQSRAPWRNRFARGLEILGLVDTMGGEGSQSEPFPGAATVNHPLIMEAVVQSQARSMAELMPPGGPVKAVVLGDATDETIEQSERVQDYMNYQCTMEDPTYYPEKEKLFMYLPAFGCAFTKTYRDTLLDRTESEFVRAEDFIAPYDASTLEKAPRYTHRIRTTGNEIRKAMRAGQYRDVVLEDSPSFDNEEGNQDLVDELDDRSPPEANRHTDRHVLYEVHIDYEVPGYEDEDETGMPTGIGLPYIITIEKDSRTILSIRRNYDHDDPLRRKRVWFTKYDYLPGFGFYGWGLLHTIGSLNEAATGLLRLIIDGGAFASLQGGFVARGAGLDKGEYVVQPGMYQTVDSPYEDLSKAFFTPRFPDVSRSLPESLVHLNELGRRFSSTTEAMVGDGDNKGPVGTTLAMIEQGSKVYSGIHQRMHKALAEEFRQRARINGEHIPAEGYPYFVEGGSRNVFAADFDERVDVIPVSDPKVFSAAQRIAKAQAIDQMAQMRPHLFDEEQVNDRMLEALDIQNPKELLAGNEPPPAMDPVSENMALLGGKPIEAKPMQDHDAHLAIHTQFFEHPQFGGHPQVRERIGAAMIAHMAEHLALKYQQVYAQIGLTVPGPQEAGDDAVELPVPVQNAIAQAAAMAVDHFKRSTGVAPPPPEQNMSPSDAAAQVKVKLAEDKHAQDMRHAEDEHAQKLRHDEEEHRQDLAQAREDTVLDERRKDHGALREQARKDDTQQAEQDRKSAEAWLTATLGRAGMTKQGGPDGGPSV